MTTLHKITLLLRPSLVSGIICTVATIVVMVVIAWSHIANDSLFYDALFGRFGVATALLFVPSNTFVIQDAILNSPITYYLIIGIAAITVGVLVYALLQGVNRFREEVDIVAIELRTHDPNLKGTVYDDLSRLGVRLASLAAWLIYCIVFINLVWPFVVSLMLLALIDINTGDQSGWLYIGAATILFAISLQLHVVFIRLCTLRMRLFGGLMQEME